MNDISYRMLLDTTGFAAGINTSVAMLGTFQRAQAAAFAPNGPKINVAQFQAEINGLNAANNTLQSSIRNTTQAEQQNTAAVKANTAATHEGSTQNVRFANSFQNIGQTIQGIRSIYGEFDLIKNKISGLTNESNKLVATNKSLENVAQFKGIPDDLIKSQVQNLALVRNGILTYGEAAQGVSNLMRSGLNLQQSIELLKGFTDMAVFGRQASLELGYAVVSGTEGWRNNNNMLLDNMGMTTNIAVLNKRAGLSEEELANKTTDSAVATKQYDAVMKELALSKGNASTYAKTFAGSQSQVNSELTLAKQKAGEYVSGGLLYMIDAMKNSEGHISGFAIALGGIASAANALLPIAAQIKIAFPEAFKSAQGGAKNFISTMTSGFGKGGAVGIAIAATLLMINELLDKMDEAERMSFKMKMEGSGIVPTQYFQKTDLTKTPEYVMPLGPGMYGNTQVPDSNVPFGPDLPPGFQKPTNTTRSPGGSPPSSSSASELETDYSNLQAEISKTEKELELLKTQLTSSGVVWNNNTEGIKKYVDELARLNKELADMKTDFVTPVNERISRGARDMMGVTLNRRAPDVEPVKLTDAQRISIYGKTKEQMGVNRSEEDMKNFVKNASQFGGALSNITGTLGIADTAFGKAAEVVSGFASTVGSVMQMINAFGGGGFDLFGSLLGAGIGFATGGPAGAVVGGIGGGGGTTGGSIRNQPYGNYQGNVNTLINSESQRVVQVPYFTEIKGSPEEFRVMVKSATDKYTRMRGVKS